MGQAAGRQARLRPYLHRHRMGTLLPPLTQAQPLIQARTSAKMVQVTGSYTQTSNEGYEEFLKKLNVGFILRKAAMASTPVMTTAEEGGNWTMITKTTVKSIELRFRLGEEFEETTTDGRKCKTTVSLAGNKMTTSQKATKAGEKDVTVVRSFDDGGIMVTLTCEDVVCTQKYSRD